ncbi:uncharacterized protein RCO7_14064 [Rhynchosporium graminicola]|uniref:Uncharacterized protein n=1 Tax=Rhynchosporium graminicola TaxID=2792576 RepID=A0A1E1LM03_9HELO|nr:uncharacterized protein RCO7_14064 [Rhynchosporium commune]
MAKDDEDVGFKRWVACDGNLSDSLDACTVIQRSLAPSFSNCSGTSCARSLLLFRSVEPIGSAIWSTAQGLGYKCDIQDLGRGAPPSYPKRPINKKCHHEVAGAIAAQDQPLLSI